jgi:hypothetical protein
MHSPTNVKFLQMLYSVSSGEQELYIKIPALQNLQSASEGKLA